MPPGHAEDAPADEALRTPDGRDAFVAAATVRRSGADGAHR